MVLSRSLAGSGDYSELSHKMVELPVLVTLLAHLVQAFPLLDKIGFFQRDDTR